MRTSTSMLLVMVLAVPVAAGAQSLPRSAGGGPENAKGGGSVPVPRYPYAGEWEGSLELDKTAGAAQKQKIAMRFTVVDGARQSYGGETSIDGRQTLQHVNISAASEPRASSPSSSSVARRSPGNAAPASGPSASSGDVDILGPADSARLLYHAPTKSMALCSNDGRCIGLATLTWQERGADGREYAYSATLSAADTISGTVKITNGKTGGDVTGTFTMTRQKK